MSLASKECTAKECGCVHYETGEDLGFPEACTCGHAIEEHEAAKPSSNRDELDPRRPRRRELKAIRAAIDACDRPALRLRLAGRLDLALEFDRVQAKARLELRKLEAAIDQFAADERGPA